MAFHTGFIWLLQADISNIYHVILVAIHTHTHTQALLLVYSYNIHIHDSLFEVWNSVPTDSQRTTYPVQNQTLDAVKVNYPRLF